MVIALIALIFVGPEELPAILRRVGRQVAQIRDITTSVRDEFMAEVEKADPNSWVEDEVVPTPKLSRNTDAGAAAGDQDSPEALAEQQRRIEGLEASERAAELEALGAAASQVQAEKFKAKADAARYERKQASLDDQNRRASQDVLDKEAQERDSVQSDSDQPVAEQPVAEQPAPDSEGEIQ